MGMQMNYHQRQTKEIEMIKLRNITGFSRVLYWGNQMSQEAVYALYHLLDVYGCTSERNGDWTTVVIKAGSGDVRAKFNHSLWMDGKRLDCFVEFTTFVEGVMALQRMHSSHPEYEHMMLALWCGKSRYKVRQVSPAQPTFEDVLFSIKKNCGLTSDVDTTNIITTGRDAANYGGMKDE
jgi:hypothetical protein